MTEQMGKSEETLRNVLTEAAKEAPSIIVIDEIDGIAPKREKANGEEAANGRTCTSDDKCRKSSTIQPGIVLPAIHAKPLATMRQQKTDH